MSEITRAGEHDCPARVIFACGFAGKATPRMRDRLLALGATRCFRSGEFLLREGERTEHVLLLLEGRVKVTSTAENGYTAVLGVYGPGDLVGEMAGLDHSPRSATVTAMDLVHARVIDGAAFRNFIDSETEAGVALAKLIASRLRMANRWRLAFAAFPVRRRVALALLDLEQWYGVNVPGDALRRDIDLPLPQADLAGLIGSSLEAVAQALRGLAGQGIITTGRRRIGILNKQALAEVADG